MDSLSTSPVSAFASGMNIDYNERLNHFFLGDVTTVCHCDLKIFIKPAVAPILSLPLPSAIFVGIDNAARSTGTYQIITDYNFFNSDKSPLINASFFFLSSPSAVPLA